MRYRNWSHYNKSLVQRGSLTFLIDPKILKTLAPLKKAGKGRPQEFSNHLIQLLLTIKIFYKLPYRLLEGFYRSLFKKLALKIKLPTYSLLCKRSKTLSLEVKLSPRQPSTILVDATGFKVMGEGEWKVKVHGKGRPRKWIKVHVAIDPQTQEVISEVTTENSVGEASAFSELIEPMTDRKCTMP